MSAEENLGKQWTQNPSLTSAKVSGILRGAGLERFTSKKGGQTMLRASATGNRLASRSVQSSGIEVSPEVFSQRRKGGRASYITLYTGRYAVGYREGISSSAKSHTPEEVDAMLGKAKEAFISAGLRVSEHHNPKMFWVHE